ncbi:MAG: hypothetical protein ACRYFR_20525 [Janthinobacterium lividum]
MPASAAALRRFFYENGLLLTMLGLAALPGQTLPGPCAAAAGG